MEVTKALAALQPLYGKENVEINHIEMSYAFKLFLDELKSLTVYPKLKLKGKY